MAGDARGTWEPLSLVATVELFSSAMFRWWITGGRALDLHVGRSWREHGDTDVGICRDDASHLPIVLAGWDIHIAAAGALTPWRGEPLVATAHQNNLWCRRTPRDAWALDITIGEGDDEHWIWRRDPTIRVPWPDAVRSSSDAIAYLAPELQLLFKSKDVRPKDEVDAREVIPVLDADRRERLVGWLPADHAWQRLLAVGRVV